MTTLLPERTAARRTVLELEAAPGRASVRLSTAGDPGTPCLRPMLLSSGPAHARVALVPDGALLLAGDAIRLEVKVGAGMRLDLVEPSGTVAFDMRGDEASWDVDVELAENASLTWAGEPFVLASGSRVRRGTTVRLGEGARFALRETLVLGRHQERTGWLDQRFTAYGPDDEPVLVEHLLLDEDVHRPGVLGGHRAIGSVLALGFSLSEDVSPGGRMDLEQGGTIWRGLAHESHRAVPAEAWRAALDAV